MDWTGGTRRRYAQKGGGNAILRKQRAHFAKVRAGEHPTLTGGFHDAPESKRFRHPLLGPDHIDSQKDVQNALYTGLVRNARSQAVDGQIMPSQHSSGSPSRQLNAISGRRSGVQEHGQILSGIDDDTGHMSTRQRLLARSDWLGLSTTRPVQMKFASSRENERIGKRRKLETQHKSKIMAAERGVSQAAAAMPHYEPRMGGAHDDDNIHIKIGTDVFASQTQRSRPSHPHVQTSIAPPDTAISANSILLSESDKLEVQSIESNGSPRFRAGEAAVLQQLTADECQLRDHMLNTAAQYQELQLCQRKLSVTSFESLTANTDKSSTSTGSLIKLDQDSLPGIEPCSIQHVHRSPISTGSQNSGVAREIDEHCHVERQYRILPKTNDAVEEDDKADDDDEMIWKQLMQIKQSDTSDESMAAVRSSSSHITKLQDLPNSFKETLVTNFARNAEQVLPTDGSSDFMEDQEPGFQYGSDPPVEQANRRSPSPEQDDFDPDENELWKQFVLGGRSTQQESSLAKTWEQQGSEVEKILPLFSSSSSTRSEAAHSNHATIGGSVFAAEPRTTALAGDGSHDGIVLPTSQDDANTSMVGHATTAGPWTEDIEDDEDPAPPPRRDSRPNRPVSRKLDPKRFKQSRKRAPYPPLPRVVPRFLPAISTTDTTATKSPYDLSDELSF